MRILFRLQPISVLIGVMFIVGCGEDGVRFEAAVDGIALNAASARAKYSASRLSIDCVQFEPDTAIIVIDINANGPGTYLCDADDPRTGNAAAYYPPSHKGDSIDTVLATNSRSTGTVTITKFDLETGRVSGSFEFQGSQVVPPGSKVVNVKGSFEDVPIAQ